MFAQEVPTGRQKLFGIATVLCAAFLSAEYSYRMRADAAPIMIRETFATLQGNPSLPEFQNRILFPLLLSAGRAMAPASLSDANLWKTLRLLTALAAYFGTFACLRSITESWFRATIGCVLLAYGYLWTISTHPYEHPTDFLGLAFIAWFVWLALRNRFGWLAVATVLASFNRGSSAFSGLIVIGLAVARHGLSREAWKPIAVGIGYVALAFATVTFIRSYFQEAPLQRHIGLLLLIENWRRALLPYGPGTALLAMFGPLGLMLLNLPRAFSIQQRGLLLGCLGCFLVTAVFGILFEARVLLPCYLLLVCVLVLDEHSSDDGVWMTHVCGLSAIRPANRQD